MKSGWKPEIIEVVLENISNHKEGITKTQLMYKSLLSYIQLVEYLTILRKSGLIEYRPSSTTYKTTKRGFRLLQMTKEMNQLVMTGKI